MTLTTQTIDMSNFPNDKNITKDRKTPMQYKEKTDKCWVPLVITYHPALKNLNSILRSNLLILYTNERTRRKIDENIISCDF